jgi:hypothetical protein
MRPACTGGRFMPGAKGLSLTPGTLVGLSCMQQYRFLTIPQFAKMTKVSYAYATRVLRKMEQRRIVGYFGYTSIPGQGKTPKIYFLTRRGYDWLLSESDGTEEIGPFRDVHREFTWTPQMYHRIRLLIVFWRLSVRCLSVRSFHYQKSFWNTGVSAEQRSGKQQIILQSLTHRQTTLYPMERLFLRTARRTGAASFLLRWIWGQSR